MVAYTSSQAHSSLEKGARMTGFGHIRLLDVDSEFAARPEALIESVEADRRAGLVPAFVGSAVGTTGTAAVDPVRDLGEIARAEQMWHHTDAAYAGSAMICEEFRHHQDGLDLVDSYTFNPHKWLATNLECSVMWIADRRPLVEALSVLPPYLRNPASESGQVIDYRDWHAPLGRPFRALKLWFVLRCFGADGLRRMIRTHVGWARTLAERIDGHPSLERIAPCTSRWSRSCTSTATRPPTPSRTESTATAGSTSPHRKPTVSATPASRSARPGRRGPTSTRYGT